MKILNYVFVLALLALCSYSNAAEDQSESLIGLTQVTGQLCLEGKPYRGMGVNYFSLFYRTLKDNSDISYQAGLKSLSDAGIPFVRFMACGFWPSDWELYLTDKKRYFKQLGDVVSSAEKNRVGLIPSLFWNMAAVPDIAGEPMDQLGNPDSKTIAFIRQYTREVVQRYKNSPAIWGWEFGNEYNLHVDLPNASKHRPPVWPKLKTASSRSARDELSSQMMLSAYAEFARVVRCYDKHRIIITGNSIARPNAWHNSKEKSWTKDSREQCSDILQRDNPDPFNMISVHIYPRDNNKYSGGFKSLPELVDGVQRIALDLKKPLFIGEFGASQTLGDADAQKKFSELLSAIEASRVPLSALWVFDHSGQNKDWNVTFDNKRSYMLKAVSEVNQRMQR